MVMNNTNSPVGDTRIEIGNWQVLAEAAQAVRHAVFVEEQRILAELERDPADAGCIHAVAFDAALPGQLALVHFGRSANKMVR